MRQLAGSSFLWHRDARFVLFGLPSNETSWKGVYLLVFVFLGSLVVGAFLAPPLYGLVEWWRASTGSDAAQWLLDKGVVKFVDRLRWIPVIIGLPWLMIVCGLWSFLAIGLHADARALRASLAWLAIGFGLVAILAACQLSFASVTPRAGPSKLAWGAADHVLTGFGASLLEEIIFRGLILRIFYTATRRPWLAILLQSLFFAYVHFKIPPSAAIYTEGGSLWSVSFFSAYWLLAGIATNFDLNRFFSLALLGMVLGTLALRSGSLWPAIGLHAGLVAAMLTYRDCCILGPAASKSFWGSTALIDGWAADIALALVLVFIVARRRGRITMGRRLGLEGAG